MNLLCTPAALGYFLPLEMKSWDPIHVFLLPYFLPGVVDVNSLELKWPL
jgi:hypothetical protein